MKILFLVLLVSAILGIGYCRYSGKTCPWFCKACCKCNCGCGCDCKDCKCSATNKCCDKCTCE